MWPTLHAPSPSSWTQACMLSLLRPPLACFTATSRPRCDRWGVPADKGVQHPGSYLGVAERAAHIRAVGANAVVITPSYATAKGGWQLRGGLSRSERSRTERARRFVTAHAQQLAVPIRPRAIRRAGPLARLSCRHWPVVARGGALHGRRPAAGHPGPQQQPGGGGRLPANGGAAARAGH